MTGSFVYLIIASNNRSYVGSTVDIHRRLRQHNKEISGGARYTSMSDNWQLATWISGFPTWSSALQFEWRWKDLTRKQKSMVPLERRLLALKELIGLERSTRSAIPYEEWTEPLEVHNELEESSSIWENIS